MPFVAAARRVGATVVLATEGVSALIATALPALRLPFDDLEVCRVRLGEEVARHGPFTALLGLDDSGSEIAAALAPALGLKTNPTEALRTARRKDLAREALAAAAVRVPWYRVVDLADARAMTLPIPFPVVVKPLALSGSRGVMRADTPQALALALARLDRLLAQLPRPTPRRALIEAFIPGREVALEGLLVDGCLQTLALFDKPEPLDGPFFEETYYITPSTESPATQEAIRCEVERGAQAYGLREGPIHAECRIHDGAVWIIEIAARTIGGLCGRLLRFGTGYSLEDVVVHHALGERLVTTRAAGAAGVLMIPIPAAGILRRIEGLTAADRVTHIVEIVIDVHEGEELIPLPEGASYLGFIFAQAPDPAQVYTALKTAHRHLRFVVAPVWRAVVGS